MPSVSVIVPNYNHARFLQQRIDSILGQTYQDFELILLDDCSTDGSVGILRGYAARDRRVRLEFNDKNSGSSFKQWNKGVRMVQGKYVWIAESDDYAGERLLERLVGVLEGDSGISLAYCRTRCVDEEGRAGEFAEGYLKREPGRWEADFCEDGREACRSFFLPYNPISNASAVVFRKSVYDEVGGADEGMRLCGDWKMWAEMALRGKIAYVSEPLNYFRMHQNSVRDKTSRARVDVPEFLYIARWVMDHAALPEAVLEDTREKLAGDWVPALMSLRVPFSVKRAIWRDVRAVDPHPIRRLMRPAATVIRLKARRHWHGLGSAVQ